MTFCTTCDKYYEDFPYFYIYLNECYECRKKRAEAVRARIRELEKQGFIMDYRIRGVIQT